MRTTWAVSRGGYDAYGVVCLCPDEVPANAARDRMNAPEVAGVDGEKPYFVESFRTIDALDEVVVVTEYFVAVDLDGREDWRNPPRSFLAWDAEEESLKSGPRHTYRGGKPHELTGAYGVSTVGYDEALTTARDELTKAKVGA